jgi:hypothetical protein
LLKILRDDLCRFSQSHAIFAASISGARKEMILSGRCMTLEIHQLHQKNKQWLIIFTSKAGLSKIPNQEEPLKLNATFISRRPMPKFS